MGISVEKVALISIFMESTFYGLFLSLFAIASVILYRGRKELKLNTTMMIVLCTMLCLATLHIGNDLQRLLNAFTTPGRDAGAYLRVVNDPSYIIHIAAYCVQTVLADCFLTYRLYLVWGRNLWIAAPFALCNIGNAVLAVIGPHAAAISNSLTLIFKLKKIILVFFALTLVGNSLATLMIAGKIWWISRQTSSLGRTAGRSLATPLELIIESGALYSLWLILQIGLYASGSFAYDLAIDSMMSIIGIAFSLIIVRLGLGLSTYGVASRPGERSVRSHGLASRFTNFTNVDDARFSTADCQCGKPGMEPIELRLSQRIGTAHRTGPSVNGPPSLFNKGADYVYDGSEPIHGHDSHV